MKVESSEPNPPTIQKIPPIFCSQAGVGMMIGVAFTVALVFTVFGSTLRPAISAAFGATISYLNNVNDRN